MTNDFKIINPPSAIIFLDVDGVLNHELFFEERFKKLQKSKKKTFFRVVKKFLIKEVKSGKIEKLDFYKAQMDIEKIEMLNHFCEENNCAVVLSAAMRGNKSVLRLNEIFQYCGATFTIIDKTGHCEDRIRGVEIHNWIGKNSERWFGVMGHNFNRYVILDDDSDMLLWQQHNFFHVDRHAGLTGNITYKMKRFLDSTTNIK